MSRLSILFLLSLLLLAKASAQTLTPEDLVGIGLGGPDDGPVGFIDKRDKFIKRMDHLDGLHEFGQLITELPIADLVIESAEIVVDEPGQSAGGTFRVQLRNIGNKNSIINAPFERESIVSLKHGITVKAYKTQDIFDEGSYEHAAGRQYPPSGITSGETIIKPDEIFDISFSSFGHEDCNYFVLRLKAEFSADQNPTNNIFVIPAYNVC